MSIDSQILSIPIYYNYFPDIITINLQIGTPPVNITSTLCSTLLYGEMFSNDIYNQSTSTSLKITNQRLSRFDNSFQGNLSSDIYTFDSFQLTNYEFNLLDTEYDIEYSDYMYKGLISLCRSTTSLLSKLQLSGLITKKVFQFSNLTRLSFGDIINPETDKRKEVRCDLIATNNRWACQFKGVSFSNSTKEIFPIKEKVIFHMTKRHIFFPYHYYQLFKEKYFGTAIDKELCEVYNGFKGWMIECDEEVARQFNHIVFHLEKNMRLELNMKELFEEDMLDYEKQIFRIFFRKNATNLHFGWDILKRFHVGFNEEKDYAVFFPLVSSQSIELDKFEDSFLMIKIYLIIVLSILLVCGVSLILIAYIKWT